MHKGSTPRSALPVYRQTIFEHGHRVGTPFEVARGQLIQAPLAPTSSLYLFGSGAAHAYLDTESGRQTIRLGYPGEVLAALPGLLLNTASPLGLQCIRRCTGYRLDRSQLQALFATSPEHQAAYTSMLEVLACELLTRELDLLEPSFRRRYETVLRRSPQLFQHVPLRYIASYLRMTPETLSRLRAKS